MTGDQTTGFEFDPIGTIHTPYPEKFAVPRQPGLVPAARSHIELLGRCNREEIVRGLEGFSHLWLVFVFHQAQRDDWKPTVRPPRLGGNRRVGVFASRSPFRPNPIGLSVVTLEGIEQSGGHWRVLVGGADLVDGTPILDIKPYLPYADALPDARANYAPEPPAQTVAVQFSEQALAQLDQLVDAPPNFRTLIEQVLAQRPQPAYHSDDERIYGMSLYHYNIQWRQSRDVCLVVNLALN
ncbi:tRNA (N6-threonylcarbamoyladenosine(37)-N6)-methyltransferase TrmO [Pseudomaricurvus alcaniphilus]|uniref:tRNA (N6-threonylcarbamoyladenosine(37)-N6)-methyltransferase TrmO n=1 Tax=Pseudomaricurvus alcaniphilus TaxID=1166482 RepID=UPI0014072F40|nr:tRNA (N6-threonylcarbamoyladenosine(37)-N6)-methyltransferase TrmO [Pseudomaricurvus alcaniphilus]NHN36075.1 tRNA (N6-threonylcarbamoyladenosine(37)-N6)-methyltransferase TrmO [Pseudomaricurvus alcaniphilus]